jgi:hypothetical protein
MVLLQKDAQSKPKRPHVTEGIARCRHGGESRREWGLFQREQTSQDMRRLGEFGVNVRWRKSNLASVRLLSSQDAQTDGRTIRIIKDAAPTLPSTFATHLVLPALLTALTHTTMSISAPSIVPLVIQLGTYVPSDEYKSLVLEPIIKLFANPDRGTRMAILEVLPEFADKLDKQTVSEKIWPHLVSIMDQYNSDPNLIDDCPSEPGFQTQSRLSVRRP